jgi:prophage DNA circulation protein
MIFRSRQDVDTLIKAIQIPFNSAEEVAADTMDAMDYRAIVGLRAAIVNYLVSSSRPLPSMLTYQFAKVLPTLVISHKLYGDASRYDEIRDENKIVHPAFCPPIGQALSS